MVKMEVLNPVAEKPKRKHDLAPRLGDLRGKTIGLYWNAKPGGNVLLERTGQLLKQKVEGIRLKRYNAAGSSGTAYASLEDFEKMSKECDGVVGTSAD